MGLDYELARSADYGPKRSDDFPAARGHGLSRSQGVYPFTWWGPTSPGRRIRMITKAKARELILTFSEEARHRQPGRGPQRLDLVWRLMKNFDAI